VTALIEPYLTGCTRVASVRRYAIQGLVLTEHGLAVPLDHARPDGETITVFAREARAAGKQDAELPWLLFLQGGPGSPATRPTGLEPWILRAARDYHVVLLDQRGTGRSTPVLAQTLARLRTPQAQADYLKHFRADSIARDAELLRGEITGGEPWALLGQSYGGFCICTYLSIAPEGVREAYVTGGLPGLEQSADDVYRATYRRLADRNRRYYARYPEDVERVRELAALLGSEDVRFRDGSPLSPRRLLQIGSIFGMSYGFEKVHYLLEIAFAGREEVSSLFLRELDQFLPFDPAPIYSLLHEACYAQGEATRWSAQRLLAEYPEFGLEGDGPVYFTGEMVYPWQFDEYRELQPLKEAAELLAEYEGWPRLYDVERLRANNVPVVAAVYENDMYVERAFSLQTAETMGARAWVTSLYEHDALRSWGKEVLDQLFKLRRGDAYSLEL
jgi:pimeloyl-ACP methyl ester carboxylesterase